MTEHELKVWPMEFDALASGRKLFEWRKDDRSPSFAIDDRLVLREWSPAREDYTGRVLEAGVTYVLRDQHGVPPGFAVLSLIGVRPRRSQMDEDRALVKRLVAIEEGLTEWEVDFVSSIARRIAAGHILTDAQRNRALQIDEGR